MRSFTMRSFLSSRVVAMGLGLVAAGGCGRFGYETLQPNEPVVKVDAGHDTAMPDQMPRRDTLLPYEQDFDEALPNWRLSLVEEGAGSLERDIRLSRGGPGALKVSKGPSTGFAYAEVSLPEPVTSGALFMRAFVFVPNSLRVQDWFVAMEMKGVEGVEDKFSFDILEADFGLDLSDAGLLLASKPFARDQWVCVEMGLQLSASDGWMRLWIDQALTLDRSGVNTLIPGFEPGVERFRLGSITGPLQGELLLWFDDWAISRNRIGCN